MAHLEEEAVVSDDQIDSAAETEETEAQPEEQASEPDGTEFYEDDQPEEEGEESENEIDDSEEEAEELPPIPAPVSLNADEKAAWDSWPREAQETMTRRVGELEKGLQEKATEASTAEQRVREVANQQLQDFYGRQAEKYQQLAAQFMPQEPDSQLLFSGNPDDALKYQQQQALYQHQTAQQQQLQSQADQQRQEAQRIENAQLDEVKQQTVATLREKLPEWFDEKDGPKLQQDLTSIGAELGYSSELMQQADATDILGLKMVYDLKQENESLKADAEKYRKLNGKRMETVRSFKSKNIPKTAKPGVGGKQQPVSIEAQLYPDDVRN